MKIKKSRMEKMKKETFKQKRKALFAHVGRVTFTFRHCTAKCMLSLRLICKTESTISGGNGVREKF
ncbi:hypothetical protein [Geomonas agri]|uniref:hypothetical protein n=1 Tax=Geomonas agri TaxID=2873702 RepID=UPI001CD376AD|nr:hypothetical protein [Geomonas agri]